MQEKDRGVQLIHLAYDKGRRAHGNTVINLGIPQNVGDSFYVAEQLLAAQQGLGPMELVT
jgi:hypothetical protein